MIHRGAGGAGACIIYQRLPECRLGSREWDPVLWAFGPGDGRHHAGQIQLEVLGVGGFPVRVMPQVLLLGVGLHQRELLGRAAGELQVAHRFAVDREDRAG